MVLRKTVVLAACSLFFGLSALAQDQPQTQTIPAWDIGGAFTLRSYYPPTSARINMLGWDGSLDYSLFHRWLSIAVEAAGTYKHQGATANVGAVDTSVYTFLAGPRVYPFGHAHKITPYADFLFGGGYSRVFNAAFSIFPSVTHTDFSRALGGGGGLDLRVSSHWDVRLIQFDYESTRFFVSSGVTGQSNYRVSVGLTYRFGEKAVHAKKKK
jgi:hypothetical protein